MLSLSAQTIKFGSIHQICALLLAETNKQLMVRFVSVLNTYSFKFSEDTIRKAQKSTTFEPVVEQFQVFVIKCLTDAQNNWQKNLHWCKLEIVQLNPKQVLLVTASFRNLQTIPNRNFTLHHTTRPCWNVNCCNASQAISHTTWRLLNLIPKQLTMFAYIHNLCALLFHGILCKYFNS